MLSMYSYFPRQITTEYAIKRLKTYFEVQGISQKEPLPTMSKIVDYCIKYPRLLRIRDSPLKVLHDANLPYVLVHDWYIAISLDYLEASIVVLLEQWEKDYRKKRHDSQQVTDLFIQLVNDVYECFEHTGLALKMPFPEGSSLAAAELKEKLKFACTALIKEKITSSFITARNIFYISGSKSIERLFQSHLNQQKDSSFAYLFSPGVSKYEGKDFEYYVQAILDTDLPPLVDTFNLSDEILRESCEKEFSRNEQFDTNTSDWFIPDDSCILPIEKYEKDRQEFSVTCDKLNALLLTPDWLGILKEIIEIRLNNSAWKDNWNVSMVTLQLKWLHVLILPWISYVIPKFEDTSVNWYNFLRQKIKAEHVLYKLIYQSRISNIFDIIREYPTTKNAIIDFHIVATKRDLLEDLQQKLIKEIQGRLLHQGASTKVILQQYIFCIQCLSIIDPSCGILSPVIELIESYMKTYRNDTIQCVVELIRDQEEDKFFPPVKDADVYVFKQTELSPQEISQDSIYFQEDTPAILRKLQEKSRDIVAMLISICPTPKDFIKGYSNKLGKVLLLTKNYDTDTEVQKLELLKRNFPADTFLRCDIMLRDLDSSKRLDKSIHENREISESFHAFILARCYWSDRDGDEDEDEDEEEELMDDDNNFVKTLWPDYKRTMELYESEFKKAKASRRLKFVPTLGSVTIELEFKTKKLRLDVSPEAASVISLFQTKEDSFTRDEIVSKLKLPKTKVVEQLEFWLKQQVLRLYADGHFRLIEE